jgi:hypothetical protein
MEPSAVNKRRKVDIEEEKNNSQPTVVIKTHLKRKEAKNSTADEHTASEWDDKESQTSLQTNQKQGT